MFRIKIAIDPQVHGSGLVLCLIFQLMGVRGYSVRGPDQSAKLHPYPVPQFGEQNPCKCRGLPLKQIVTCVPAECPVG